MPRMTNPDNGMMEDQQEADRGQPPAGGAAPALAGTAIASPIPRLPEGVDADGMLERAQDPDGPDGETEAARKDAIEVAAAHPLPAD